jgi:hypothetical protein
MPALRSRTEISLILQKLTEKLANFLSGGYQYLRPKGVARYTWRELFPERSSVDRRYPFHTCQTGKPLAEIMAIQAFAFALHICNDTIGSEAFLASVQ